jgi:hypothetical protein
VTSAQKTRAKNARVDARERHLWVARRGGAGGLDFDQGAMLPCRPPSNPQPSLRAVVHHLIRLHDLRVVISGPNAPQFAAFSRET